ncbi:hypothetical protein [Hymenobacter glacialis]|uniref:hypothetical protein n=1 Tax=Hymenobacter glacialis TaxID=1908236 RepID=UPI000F785077|nr:hypothetical protein [Hymenobacter glacialis]
MSTLLVSCGVRQEEVAGVYIVKNQTNNWDTLRILNDGTYTRRLRSKHNSFVFTNTDKWSFEEGRITLFNYLLDEDYKYKTQTNLQGSTITSSLPIEKRAGKVVIYYRQSTDDFFYEKM